MDTFTRQYLVTALWSSTDDEGNPLDDAHGIDDIHPDTIAKAEADCADFQAFFGNLLDQAYAIDGVNYDVERAAHDFWLTRNHHGVGFWDRGLGIVGERLTDAAHAFGEIDLYIGDDGMIHS